MVKQLPASAGLLDDFCVSFIYFVISVVIETTLSSKAVPVSSSRLLIERGSPSYGESAHNFKLKCFSVSVSPFRLRFRLLHVIAPDINTMSPHQHRIRIRIPIHRYLQTRRQVLLVRGVFDDRHRELVEVSEHALLAFAAGDTFDLLDLLDLEACV